MADRVVSGKQNDEEGKFELSLRPRRLNEYIGQDKVKNNLRILIEAAKGRSEAIDHTLLYGPPGLGKCITADSLILTAGGLIEFRKLIPSHISPGEYSPSDIQVYGRNGIEPASHVYSSGRVPTIRLRTRSGFELEGTPNHPVLVATPAGPQWKPLGELTANDHVAIARGTQIWGAPQQIRFTPPHLNGATRRLNAQRRVQQAHAALSQSLQRPPTGVELELAYGGTIRGNPSPYLAAHRLGLPLSDGRQVASQKVTTIAALPQADSGCRFPKVLDADLAYLMGLLVGDGHFERGSNSPAFVITATEVEIQNEIVRICKDKFGWNPRFQKYGDKAPRARFGQNLGHLMLHLGVKHALAGEKEVPSSVLAGSAEVARGFLQGLFDSDGHAWTDGYVDWSSKSEVLAKQVQILLANFGVISHRTSKRVHGETYWQLFMGGQDAALFYKEIGFRLTRKQARSAGLTKFRRGPSRADAVPFAHVALVELLGATRPHSRRVYKEFEHARAGDRVLSRSQIHKLLNQLPESAQSLPAAGVLQELMDPHCYWDRVAALEPGIAETFDFCVPGTHSFVANGFYNHNTTLANIIANEMGVSIKTTSGPAIERPGDLAAILTNLRAGDVLFVDEVHRLARAVEEVLYPAMEDFNLDIIIGKGPSARSLRLPLPHFTLIGATTRFAMLSAPLRDRFGAIYRLDFYDQGAMDEIVRRSAGILGVPIEEEGVQEIARRARGTPRVANRLLKRVRDYAQVRAEGTITPQVARAALSMLEVDPLGLDETDRKVLRSIIEKFGGGPVGLDTIAASISEESDTIMDVYEPYLLQLGFLDRTPRGRIATRRAYEHLGIKYPESPQQLSFGDNDKPSE